MTVACTCQAGGEPGGTIGGAGERGQHVHLECTDPATSSYRSSKKLKLAIIEPNSRKLIVWCFFSRTALIYPQGV